MVRATHTERYSSVRWTLVDDIYSFLLVEASLFGYSFWWSSTLSSCWCKAFVQLSTYVHIGGLYFGRLLDEWLGQQFSCLLSSFSNSLNLFHLLTYFSSIEGLNFVPVLTSHVSNAFMSAQTNLCFFSHYSHSFHVGSSLMQKMPNLPFSWFQCLFSLVKVQNGKVLGKFWYGLFYFFPFLGKQVLKTLGNKWAPLVETPPFK